MAADESSQKRWKLRSLGPNQFRTNASVIVVRVVQVSEAIESRCC